VVEELREHGVGEEVLLLAGGIIPEDDIEAVKALGFSAVFGPGTDTRELVEFIRGNAGRAEVIELPVPQP
jgi:methylmalonyl-CoA mutase C-terminal domain/subunit